MFTTGTFGGRRSLWTLQIYLLYRFNKTREIFPSVTWVLSILLTSAANSASVERVNSREIGPKVPCSIPGANYAEMRALCTNNPANVYVPVKRWKWWKGYKEIAFPFPYCLVNRKYSWKKSQVKQSELCVTTCWCMVDEERLESFMTDVLIVQKSAIRFEEQINMDWFLYDRNNRHKSVFMEIYYLIMTK